MKFGPSDSKFAGTVCKSTRSDSLYQKHLTLPDGAGRTSISTSHGLHHSFPSSFLFLTFCPACLCLFGLVDLQLLRISCVGWKWPPDLLIAPRPASLIALHLIRVTDLLEQPASQLPLGMPFVYDRKVSQESANKRRKISGPPVMARRQWEEDDEDTRHHELPLEPPREAVEKEELVQTSNREELMECIKRGKSTVWVPGPALERLAAIHSSSGSEPTGRTLVSTGKSMPREIGFPSAQSGLVSSSAYSLQDPIERPRSALHAGDFRQHGSAIKTPQKSKFSEQLDQTAPFNNLCTSPPTWLDSPPVSSPGRSSTDPRGVGDVRVEGPRRHRASSRGSSLSSSFVMRVPTSPLVNATSHSSYDPDVPSLSTSPDKSDRRRTLPPESFRPLRSIPADVHAPNFSRPFIQPKLNRENSAPSRSHQPRRSLTSFTYQPTSMSHMPPFLRTRRPSVTSDASPRASMVGSFEESILRGRMSTAPSKPIDFIAQIGVLGKGNCKPSLRCPAHAIVPFPAVFYNYTSLPNSKSAIDENPSPYVGNIDLEHHLKPVETARMRKQKALDARDPEQIMADITAPENTAIGRALARDAKAKRPEVQLKVPPGGCYRIPQEGQLQIIIKNPNKTAVKLYLVPYDLSGMEPGTKTFVRQRSYSAGPIIDQPISADVQGQQKFDLLQDKHILRYLIHLKICCLSKDRFYLYDNIRIVFANRVPDDKEKLRNETQLPHPKYTPYKPGKQRSRSNSEVLTDRTNQSQTSNRATTFSSQDVFDEVESLCISEERRLSLSTSQIHTHAASRHKAALSSSGPFVKHDLDTPPVPQLPFQFRDISGSQAHEPERAMAPTSGFGQASTSARSSPVSWNDLKSTSKPRSFSPVPPESGDGLLSRKLRGLNDNGSERERKHD
jgi:hypothetical protein